MSSRWEATALRGLGSCALLALGAACNAFDPPLDDSDIRLIIPTDTRPPVVATRKPPPVNGGTLLVTQSGTLAVASDPERDQIVIADIASTTLLGTIALEAGDEPGRLVEDSAGRVHVALRRGGAVATIDPIARTLIDRRSVCGAPRGLVLSTPDTLEVACADGKLVTLPAGPGAALRTVSVAPDLRDVVVSNGELVVSRFKSAEVLRLGTDGTIQRTDVPASVWGTRQVPVEADEDEAHFSIPREIVQPFRPLVAWRTLAGPNGSTIVVHQRAVDGPIDIAEPSPSGSAYGGAMGLPCSGIAQNAVTILGPDGGSATVTFSGPPLPVDAALLASGRQLVIAHAGPADPHAPRPFVMFDGEGAASSGGFHGPMLTNTLSVLTLPIDSPAGNNQPGAIAPDPGCTFAGAVDVGGPAVAVAANPARPSQVVVQTQQPSTLVVIDDITQAWARRIIDFDDGQTLDTGFQLFHADSGGGIACASCHPGGAEDGHAWNFTGFGLRRTQPLNVGLAGTAPFHWDGTLLSVGALMDEVFVGRMGGIGESNDRLAVLADWLFALKPIASLRSEAEAAVQRGKALFESASTQCASCHSGPKLTNNLTVHVGTSHVALQVPSLVGVGYRAPFMHDGCAPTLEARFDPACGGGERHGRTAHLSVEERADLVAYLESL